MKKLLALSLSLAFLLIIVGCGEDVVVSAPGNFVISAAADEISVVLDWDPNPSDEEVDGYIIYFNSVAVDTTENETYTHTDPQESGDYYVTAYKGEDESDPSTTQTTIPVIDDNVELAEIGATGESGYGWNTTSGQGTEYSMADATYAGSIDLYFTDFATGYAGTYNIASPDLVLSDPGASWLAGTSGWRLTGFDPLPDDFDDVTVVPLSGYVNYEEIVGNTTYAVYTEDGHYGLVEVQSWSTTTGMVQLRTAFQTVPGLAILEH